MVDSKLRTIDPPFVALGPSGVAIRDRLKELTAEDETVLRAVGDLLGSLAGKDLKTRAAAAFDHDSDQWAERKRALTGRSSSRWAGSITKATHDQWALARRCQLAHIQCLEAGIRTIAHRLSLPVGETSTRRAPGGYRTAQEWFAKTRRLHVLEDRLATERADREAGRRRTRGPGRPVPGPTRWPRAGRDRGTTGRIGRRTVRCATRPRAAPHHHQSRTGVHIPGSRSEYRRRHGRAHRHRGRVVAAAQPGRARSDGADPGARDQPEQPDRDRSGRTGRPGAVHPRPGCGGDGATGCWVWIGRSAVAVDTFLP